LPDVGIWLSLAGNWKVTCELLEVRTWMSLASNWKVTCELPEVGTWMSLAGNWKVTRGWDLDESCWQLEVHM